MTAKGCQNWWEYSSKYFDSLISYLRQDKLRIPKSNLNEN